MFRLKPNIRRFSSNIRRFRTNTKRLSLNIRRHKDKRANYNRKTDFYNVNLMTLETGTGNLARATNEYKSL